MRKIFKVLGWFLLIVIIVVAGVIGYSYVRDAVSGPAPDSMNLSDLRSLNTALQTYHSAYGHYPDSLRQLGVPKSGPNSDQGAGLLGSKLAAGDMHGYRYSYAKTANGYEINADPSTAQTNVHLYTDQTAEIRMQRNKKAGGNSKIAQ